MNAGRARYWPWLVFVLSLVLPLLLHLVHADVAALILAWLALAGYVRAGHSVLDRLVLGGLLLAGLLLAEGWLFSLWPWGLEPVPAGMVLLGGISGVAAWRGRRWSVPRNIDSSDVVILAASGVGLWFAARPLSGLGLLDRIGYETTITDRIAHFALFDAIPNVGGFTFFHQAAARQFVLTPTEVVYPQGSHFLLALANNFLSSTNVPEVGVGLLNRYTELVLVVYAVCVAAAAWAARWIAGPGAAEPVRCVVAAGAALFVLLGPTAHTLAGTDSQLFGMAVLPVAGALAIRPVADYGERLLLFAAATLVAFYAYNPFGPYVVLACVLSAAVYRMPMIAQWRLTVAVVLPTAVIALYPSYLSLTSDTFDPASQAAVEGAHLPMSWALLPFVGVVALAPLAFPRSWADRSWRGFAAVTVSVLLILGGFELFSLATGGGSYYGGKLITGAYMLFVAMIGSYGALAPRPHPSRDPAAAHPASDRHPGSDRIPTPGEDLSRASAEEPAEGLAVPALVRAVRRRPFAWGRLVVLPAIFLIVLAGTSFVQQRLPAVTDGTKAYGTEIPLQRWASGGYRNLSGGLDEYLAEIGLTPAPRPTIIVPTNSRSQTWGATLFVSAMSSRLGQMDDSLYWLNSFNDLKGVQLVDVGGNQALVTSVRLAAQVSPSPPAIVVYNQSVASNIITALALAPKVEATVTVDPKLQTSLREG